MHSREIISVLQRDGWVQVAQKGSHVQLKHPVKMGRGTVPIVDAMSRRDAEEH